MSDTTQAFFERLAQRGYEPLLHSVSGTIQSDIEGAGSWFVVVNNGSLTVSRDATEADCAFTCSREDFERMVVGKQNPTTLFLLLQGAFAGGVRWLSP
ncbi:MAG TPA: SCP2 sterol-binding domain-containing protein [Ktedonobacteraceae bacterium]|nr:SCP2 sterol-binding domain-containing protein [Ktedonobacteraceae bacterium]